MKSRGLITGLVVALYTASMIVVLKPSVVNAANLTNRRLNLSSSVSAASATYQLNFDIITAAILGSIEIQFCSNDPLIDEPCTAPSDFDISGASLSSQTGETGFSVHANSTSNTVILTRSPALATAQAASYTFDNVINTSALGTQYIRLTTYASTDATGSFIDKGGIAYVINAQLTVTTEVPPILLFCVGITIVGNDCGNTSGSYINFGELSSSSTAKATSQMLAATNAQSGYSIILSGTTMTAGNTIIPAMNGGNSQIGVSQFGINARQNSVPSVGLEPSGVGTASAGNGYGNTNQYTFASGDTIVTHPSSDDARKFTLSYIVNAAKDQPAGRYTATISYICLANF